MKGIIRKVTILGIILLLIFTGACSRKDIKAYESSEVEENIEIAIRGLREEYEIISLEKLKGMEIVTKEMQSITSSGEVKTKKVKGVPLEGLLRSYETSQKNYGGIRFIAGDSYSIVVPKEIIEKREIILAYEVDDKPLAQKSQPLMVAVPDERSMYWVKNLIEIELLEEQQSVSKKVVFLETIVSSLDTEDYTYYEDLDKVVKVTDLLKGAHVESHKEGVYIKAADGLDKEEDVDVFKTGYIKITGKGVPLFLSPDLPKGMHVKDILFFTYGDSVFFSLDKGLETLEEKKLGDKEGISLKDLLKEVDLVNGKRYICTAEDGYKLEVSADDLDKSLIYGGNGEGFTLIFEGMSKEKKVKGIHSIEAVK